MLKPEKLREIRKKHGISQVSAAELVYCCESTYRVFESGKLNGQKVIDNYQARTELLLFKLGYSDHDIQKLIG